MLQFSENVFLNSSNGFPKDYIPLPSDLEFFTAFGNVLAKFLAECCCEFARNYQMVETIQYMQSVNFVDFNVDEATAFVCACPPPPVIL